MGGEKKWFCPVVLPIILIERLQCFFLFVVKQNKTKRDEGQQVWETT